MVEHKLTSEQITAFDRCLQEDERASGTREKYLRDLRAFARWLAGTPVTKDAVAQWKAHLLEQKYTPATVNSMLSALNSFFRFGGWEECRVKFLKIQRQVFRDPKQELTREEYERLLAAAHRRGQRRLALLIETIGGTGIRVSEVPFITVEAVRQGRAEIRLKGKIRTILIPGKLCRKILKYAGKHKIASGEIFITRSGKSLSRRQIWAEMKGLCKDAGVDSSKVFPHNLRHLFATVFYRASKDIVKLADVLGHSSIETTRIYLLTSGMEHAKYLEQLGLVS